MATGVRSAGQHLLESTNLDRVNEDFENFIDYDDKTRWPMAAWASRKENSEQKDTEEFTLFTGELIPRALTITTTITTTDAAAVVGVSSTDGIVAKTLIHVPLSDGAGPGEMLRVTAVTTSVAVTRLTTDAQIPDNSTGVIIGNFDTETSTSGPAAFDMEPASVVGYMTILKRRIDITKTERNSATRGSRDRLSEKLDRAKMDFMLDIEHNSWFSRPVKDATNRMRFSMGIFTQIANDASSVKVDAENNALVDADIGDAVAQSARWNTTNNFACFHGQQAMAGLWELGMGNMQTRVTDKRYGFPATEVAAPGGVTLSFVYARVFDIIGDPYASMIIGLDMGAVKNVHLKEGRPRLERNVQTDKSGETEAHQFRAQCGISIAWPKRHWIVRDITNI